MDRRANSFSNASSNACPANSSPDPGSNVGTDTTYAGAYAGANCADARANNGRANASALL